jgi:hypothetical protein
LIFLQDATAIALRDPLACPGCSRPHCLFLNRFGSTLCVDCDVARKEPRTMTTPRTYAGYPLDALLALANAARKAWQCKRCGDVWLHAELELATTPCRCGIRGGVWGVIRLGDCSAVPALALELKAALARIEEGERDRDDFARRCIHKVLRARGVTMDDANANKIVEHVAVEIQQEEERERATIFYPDRPDMGDRIAAVKDELAREKGRT